MAVPAAIITALAPTKPVIPTAESYTPPSAAPPAIPTFEVALIQAPAISGEAERVRTAAD